MSEVQNMETVAEETPETQENPNLVKFTRPYTFEKKEYREVDLSGLEGMTIQDAINVQKQLFSEQEIAASLLTETTTAYALALAVRASGKPVEFFKLMPRGLSRQVTRRVREFAISNEKGTENHIMQLEQPYCFGGKTYTEIDLRGIADLNAMSDAAAENRMAREGFVVTETSFNYLYACVIAAMATGLPEEFFTGLPICETVKLKNAVNDGDFFE